MSSFLDNCNTVDSRLCQAVSILEALLANDHFADICRDTLAGSLWAVQDAIKAAVHGANAMHHSWEADRQTRDNGGAGDPRLKTTLLELREIKENAEAIVFSCESLAKFNAAGVQQ
jgi:hypothetical protein